MAVMAVMAVMMVAAVVVTAMTVLRLLLLLLLNGNGIFSVSLTFGIKTLNPLWAVSKHGSDRNFNFRDFMSNWGVRIVTLVPVFENTPLESFRRDRGRVTLRERGDNRDRTQRDINLFALFGLDRFLARSEVTLTPTDSYTTAIATQDRGDRDNWVIDAYGRLGNYLVRDRGVNEGGSDGRSRSRRRRRRRRGHLLRGQDRDRLRNSAGDDRKVNVVLAALVAGHHALQLGGRGGRGR